MRHQSTTFFISRSENHPSGNKNLGTLCIKLKPVPTERGVVFGFIELPSHTFNGLGGASH